MVIVLGLATALFYLLVGVGVKDRVLSTRESCIYIGTWLGAFLLVKLAPLGIYLPLATGALTGATLIMDRYLIMRVLGWEPIVPQWNGRFPWR